MKTLLLAVVVLLVGCRKAAPPEPIQEYPMRGEVLQLDETQQLATVKHEEIKGWMGAMTMEYPVKDKAEFARLHKGEKFDATVFVQADKYWVGRIRPITGTP